MIRFVSQIDVRLSYSNLHKNLGSKKITKCSYRDSIVTHPIWRCNSIMETVVLLSFCRYSMLGSRTPVWPAIFVPWKRDRWRDTCAEVLLSYCFMTHCTTIALLIVPYRNMIRLSARSLQHWRTHGVAYIATSLYRNLVYDAVKYTAHSIKFILVSRGNSWLEGY